MAGRPAKPTALKLLQGNPGGRRLNTREPRPETGAPTRPEWLDAEAKREWSRVVPELARLGLLAKIDRGLIAAYCQTWAQYVRAVKVIERLGMTFETASGYLTQRPEVGIANAALAKMLSLSAKFGFTPSDRARIVVPEAPPADPFAEFLGKKRSG